MQHDSRVRRPAGECGLHELPLVATPMVREVLERIGRTEDVRFSPDNRRLAIATFFRSSITLVDVEITDQGGRPQVALTGAVELSGPDIVWPHGVEFLDDDTIVVASRERRVSTHHLPSSRARGSNAALTRVGDAADAGYAGIVEAGSVRRTIAPDGVQLLVCDSVQGVVTRHQIDTTSAGPRSGAGQVMASERLGIPDGVAATADGRFVAVSNHQHQCVLVYDGDAGGDPVAVLRGAVYPHGLSFTPDGRHLVVADANGPNIAVFEAATGTWSGVQYPVATLQVMDDETFQRGHHNSLEGGPKGLDIDRSGRVVAVTSHQQPLAFFALDEVLAQRGAQPGDDDRRVAYELSVIQEQAGMVDRMLLHERERSERLRARTEEAEAAAREQAATLRALEQTKTFRFTRRLRRAYGHLRRG